MSYDFKNLKEKVDDIVSWLGRELSSIRTGRATIAILDSVRVESYGVRSPIQQVANMSIEDARTIRITPWDKGLTKEIEKAIQIADLGISTVADGAGLRVIFPELTTESRQKFVKIIWAKVEEAKISVRNERNKTNTDISNKEKSNEIAKDDAERYKDEVQKIIDETVKAFDEKGKAKEKEIMS